MTQLLASIELGGTKSIVACARDPGQLLARVQFPTDAPEVVLPRLADALREMAAAHGPIAGLGIASFGPIDLAEGRMLATPKPGWSGVDVAQGLRAAVDGPVAIDTDVNAAAIAEARLGAGRGSRNLAYVTVGTGIGVGLLLDDRPRHGLLHPEAGHVRLRRHPDDDFAGSCPFHRDCLEGLAAGPAIAARLGQPLDRCADDHPFRAILVDYLAQLAGTLLLVASVDRVVIGGGVLRNLDLHAAIEARTRADLAGYLGPVDALGRFVVPPILEDAGLVGGLLMAAAARA